MADQGASWRLLLERETGAFPRQGCQTSAAPGGCSTGPAAQGATHLRFWSVLWVCAWIAIPTVNCHITGQHLQHLCLGHGACRQSAEGQDNR